MSTIKTCSVKVVCPRYHVETEVYIRCLFSQGKLMIANCNGCDTGYNGSDVCLNCTDKCFKEFMSNYSKD
jgi:hypothetical protein